MSQRRRFMLPTGEETTDADRYIKAWRALGRPLAEAVGGVLHSFDPNISIFVDGHVWAVPRAVAMKLVDRLAAGPQPKASLHFTAPSDHHHETPNRRRRLPRAGTEHSRRKATK